jgi:hypothetical protein
MILPPQVNRKFQAISRKLNNATARGRALPDAELDEIETFLDLLDQRWLHTEYPLGYWLH